MQGGAFMLAIRLPDELEKRLNALVRRTGRTKSYYVREALFNQIDDLEDYYLGMETLERIRKGEEAVYSESEARRELGLED